MPSPSFDPSKALACNSIRCVARVSENFKGNLRFNLYELKHVTKLDNFGNLTLDGLNNFGRKANSSEKMLEGDFDTVRLDESLLSPKKTSLQMARVGCRSSFGDLIDALFPLNYTSNAERHWRVEAIASDEHRKLIYDVVEEPNRVEEKRGPVENGNVYLAPLSHESVATGYDDAHQRGSSGTSGAETDEKDDLPTETDNLEFGIKNWLDKSLLVVTFSVVGSLLVVSLLSMALYFCQSRTKRKRQVSTYTTPFLTPKSSIPDIWI